jgi:hypothetical protein
MADENKVAQFSFRFVEPAEHLLATARAFAASPDENRRAVGKALLDVTAAGVAIKKAIEEKRNADLAPYLDFWFADAVACGQKLLLYEDSESRDLARCLIDAEQAVIASKESVLSEIKRLGLKPGNG